MKMKERIVKLCNIRNVMIFLIVVYLLSLVPLCMISKYNYPSADVVGEAVIHPAIYRHYHHVFSDRNGPF